MSVLRYRWCVIILLSFITACLTSLRNVQISKLSFYKYLNSSKLFIPLSARARWKKKRISNNNFLTTAELPRCLHKIIIAQRCTARSPKKVLYLNGRYTYNIIYRCSRCNVIGGTNIGLHSVIYENRRLRAAAGVQDIGTFHVLTVCDVLYVYDVVLLYCYYICFLIYFHSTGTQMIVIIAIG